jgi:hypothetical protein
MCKVNKNEKKRVEEEGREGGERENTKARAQD